MPDQDEKLATLIRGALLRDVRLSSQPVQVSVTRGLVTLRGCVQSHRRKLAALEVAASFHGCRNVTDELQVEPPTGLSDEIVANHVRGALMASEDVTKEAVIVDVSGGVVVLSGTVASQWERMVAEDVALSCRGVRCVRNLLVVDFREQIEDESLAREIQETISQTHGLEDAAIHVAVSQNSAVLSGQVRYVRQSQLAEAISHRFPLRTIRNEISIAIS